MVTAEDIGQRIKALRKKHGLKQSDFVAGLGITPSYLSKIEHGLERPGRELLLKMVKEFNISIDWLLYGEENESSIRTKSEKETLLLTSFRDLSENEAETILALLIQMASKNKKKS